MYKVLLIGFCIVLASCQKKTMAVEKDQPVVLTKPTVSDMLNDKVIKPEKEPIVNDCYFDRKVERTIVKERGKIMVQGKHVLIEQADKGARYLPCADQIPRDFRKDGIDIVFTASVLEIRPNERLRGTPLRIEEISKK